MNCDWYFSIENNYDNEPHREKKEICHHEKINRINPKKEGCHRQSTHNYTRNEYMCSEEDKSVGIFRIGKEIYTIDDTCEKKYAVIEEGKINREPENLSDTQRYAHQSGVEKYTGTKIERLFKGIAFWHLLFEKFRPTNDIKRRNNLWNKENPYHYNHRHLNISVKKEKNNRKDTMYETREKKHKKIILSRSELQESSPIISEKSPAYSSRQIECYRVREISKCSLWKLSRRGLLCRFFGNLLVFFWV